MLGVQGRRQGPGVWAADGQSGLCGGAQAWAGLRTAPATGMFGRRWSGSTTSPSLATSRNRSLTEAMTDVFWSPSAP